MAEARAAWVICWLRITSTKSVIVKKRAYRFGTRTAEQDGRIRAGLGEKLAKGKG